MPEYRFRAHHFVRPQQAYLFFDMGLPTDDGPVEGAFAWHIQRPDEIHVQCEGTLDDPLAVRPRAWYEFSLSGMARGIWMPRQRWMDEDFRAPPEVAPRRRELEP